MQNELLEQLEEKIGQLLDEVELLRMEVSELKEEKNNLQQTQADSTDRLKSLLARFDQEQG